MVMDNQMELNLTTLVTSVQELDVGDSLVMVLRQVVIMVLETMFTMKATLHKCSFSMKYGLMLKY